MRSTGPIDIMQPDVFATTNISSSAVAIATIVAGVPAVFFVGSWLRDLFRRTIGRRHGAYRRLHRLGNGAQLSFFSGVLGEAPAVRRTVTSSETHWDDAQREYALERTYMESFWVDEDFYVQAITDADETVIAFSITTRRRRFRPTFVGGWDPGWFAGRRFKREHGFRYRPLYRITLGRTRFAQAVSEVSREPLVGGLAGWGVGARTHHYSESHYFGNPGAYQWFVFTNNSASRGLPFDWTALSELGQLLGPASEAWHPDPEAPQGSLGAKANDLLGRFRSNSAITTLTIIGPSPNRDPNWMPDRRFGPHEDTLRTIP